MQEEFGLHPLSIEDATSRHEFAEDRAVLDVLVPRRARHHAEGRRPCRFTRSRSSSADRFVVTVREGPAYPLEAIERRWRAKRHDRDPTRAGTLLYYLLDAIVDGYARDRRGRHGPRRGARRPALRLRAPLEGASFREDLRHEEADAALPPLGRADAPRSSPRSGRAKESIGKSERAYLRGRLGSRATRHRADRRRPAICSRPPLDIHFSVNAQQQNEVAKQLTIVATIFLPLTFVHGVLRSELRLARQPTSQARARFGGSASAPRSPRSRRSGSGSKRAAGSSPNPRTVAASAPSRDRAQRDRRESGDRERDGEGGGGADRRCEGLRARRRPPVAASSPRLSAGFARPSVQARRTPPRTAAVPHVEAERVRGTRAHAERGEPRARPPAAASRRRSGQRRSVFVAKCSTCSAWSTPGTLSPSSSMPARPSSTKRRAVRPPGGAYAWREMDDPENARRARPGRA